jgi:hypothetical protein
MIHIWFDIIFIFAGHKHLYFVSFCLGFSYEV